MYKILVLAIIFLHINLYAETSFVKQGDTLFGILSDRYAGEEISLLAKDIKKLHKGFVLRPGMEINKTDESVSILIANDTELIFYRDNGTAKTDIQKYEHNVMPTIVKGKIDTSLYQSILDLGEDPELAASLARIYEWEFDFFKDFRKGDTFKVLVEKRFVRNRYVGYGSILAAEFMVRGKQYRAYRFASNGKTGYYNEEGRPLERGFLRVPLKYTRISSVYTNRRLHPITKELKAHYGIDYAAPVGTPVMVTASGTVTKMTYSKAAGNYIEVSHANNYKTYYLHLNKFNGYVRKGSIVSQGQIIGYVGNTGYSTGPHLDYRIRKGSKWLNPQNFIADIPKMDKNSKIVLAESVAKYSRILDSTIYLVNNFKSVMVPGSFDL